MPPNVKGGKKYKKTKHASENEAVRFIEKEEDQMYSRVIKMLGGNNISAYCNDNVIRICHIRGSMRNRVWLNPGDMILISLRNMADDKGDVIMKYDPSLLGKLKKLDDINPRLFLSMENGDTGIIKKQEGDLFEIEEGVAEESSELGESEIDDI